MTAGPDEERGYSRGYQRGRRTAQDRAEAATFLFLCLVDGLIEQGLTPDEILDAQLIGAKARQP